MLDVGLGVLDVERRVRYVEVAAQHGLPAAARGLVPQLAHAREHGVEEAVFLRHLHRIVAVARVHVHACDGDSIALWRRHVGLDPSAGIHILVQPGQTVSPGCHGQVGQQPDAGASLDAADLVHRRQLALVGTRTRRISDRARPAGHGSPACTRCPGRARPPMSRCPCAWRRGCRSRWMW